MKAIKEIVMREIAGETVLIPVESAALRLHGMISLSESGALLWKMLENECSFEQLVQAILKEYDIDHETAVEDVKSFVSQMKRLEIIN